MSQPLGVVVVGASSGFGAALSADLAGAGHRVLAGARRPRPISSGTWAYQQVDVTSAESVAGFAMGATSQLGGVDGLVYCAADTGGVAPAWQIKSPEFARVLDVSLLGFVRVVNELVPHMGRRGGGSVIAVGSQAARVPADLLAAYGSAKAALEHYTLCLARELYGTGVRANVIGIAAETPLTATHREAKARLRGRPSTHPPLPQPVDSVALARWLLSPEARHVTGQTIEARQPDPAPTNLPEKKGAFR